MSFEMKHLARIAVYLAIGVALGFILNSTTTISDDEGDLVDRLMEINQIHQTVGVNKIGTWQTTGFNYWWCDVEDVSMTPSLIEALSRKIDIIKEDHAYQGKGSKVWLRLYVEPVEPMKPVEQ